MPTYQHIFFAYIVQHTRFSEGKIVKLKKVLFRYCYGQFSPFSALIRTQGQNRGTLHFVETFSRSCILHKLLKSLHSGETFLQFVETMICILAKLFAICRNYVLHSVETFMLLVETVLHFGETFSDDSFHIFKH